MATDPIFPLIDEAKRLRSAWGEVSDKAEREYLLLPKKERDAMRDIPEAERGPLHAAADAAATAWLAASKRVQDAKPGTLAGFVARLKFLSEEGEFDFNGARRAGSDRRAATRSCGCMNKAVQSACDMDADDRRRGVPYRGKVTGGLTRVMGRFPRPWHRRQPP